MLLTNYPGVFGFEHFLYMIIIDYKYFTGNALNLHAYYEYYTTVWIYQDSKWRLALPYIYTDNKWNMSLSSVYTPDKEWKL